MHFLNCSLSELENIANNLAQIVIPGDIIALKGDLGTGKTTFARALIKNLTDEKFVSSPTFSIVKIYPWKNSEIWHADLYRLKNIDEIYEIGIYDIFGEYLTLIEWPEIIEKLLPTNRLEIEFEILGENRNIKFNKFGEWNDKILKFR